jgi:pantoate--beta-alanine ligase
MYPEGFATAVRVAGLSDVLCGAVRPGHFDGVAQVVTKYLNQAQADVAIFGEKDWQQLAIIRRLARDLDMPTTILGAPIARAEDGLALSSRNRYLTPAQRRQAPALYRAIGAAAEAIAGGAPVAASLQSARAQVLAGGFARVEYLELADAATLQPVDSGHLPSGARIFAAAWLGKARLIDNVPVPG